MCYSFRSSVVAFSIAIITVYFMYIRQTLIDKYIAPLIFAYAFVQLGEAFMWYDTKCEKLNKIGTYIAYFSLISHVLASGFGVYFTENKTYGIFIGCLFIIYYLFTMPKIECSKPIDINMNWGFNPGFYWYIFIGVFIVYFSSKMKLTYKFLIHLWYGLTYIYFFYKQYKKKITKEIITDLLFNKLGYHKNSGLGELGSLWCNIASMSAPLLYLVQHVLK